ncbi:hypothetical protein BTS2_1194 [Bacillus sp. TS-2]|nr:hypothetical protein BTS2_1194 [Bacillus sp. TS-2]
MDHLSTNRRIDSASRVILASPPTIYQAFLNPKSFISWLPPQGMTGQIVSFDPREGGAYKMTLTYVADATLGKTSHNTDETQGLFLELVKNERIVLTVHFNSTDPAFQGEMIQKWLLEEVSGGTKVTVNCYDVPTGVRKEDHLTGLQSTLANLALFTEQ